MAKSVKMLKLKNKQFWFVIIGIAILAVAALRGTKWSEGFQTNPTFSNPTVKAIGSVFTGSIDGLDGLKNMVGAKKTSIISYPDGALIWSGVPTPAGVSLPKSSVTAQYALVGCDETVPPPMPVDQIQGTLNQMKTHPTIPGSTSADHLILLDGSTYKLEDGSTLPFTPQCPSAAIGRFSNPTVKMMGYVFTGSIDGLNGLKGVPGGKKTSIISYPDGALIWSGVPTPAGVSFPKSSVTAQYAIVGCDETVPPPMDVSQIASFFNQLKLDPKIAGINSIEHAILLDGSTYKLEDGSKLPFTPTCGMPMWEIGLFVVGGICIVGGLVYFLSRGKASNAPVSNAAAPVSNALPSPSA